MNYVEKHIVNAYSGLFNGLSSYSKLELLENLAKSIKKGSQSKEKEFFKSFGAFGSNNSAEEIIDEIKKSRKFKNKNLNF